MCSSTHRQSIRVEEKSAAISPLRSFSHNGSDVMLMMRLEALASVKK
jgi:hypothetical protein